MENLKFSITKPMSQLFNINIYFTSFCSLLYIVFGYIKQKLNKSHDNKRDLFSTDLKTFIFNEGWTDKLICILSYYVNTPAAHTTPPVDIISSLPA